jgi:hypothetical protein
MTNINLQNSTQETKDLKIAQHEPHRQLWVNKLSSISGTRRVTLDTKPVINHEWGKDEIVTHIP